jgi:hypothetical protein
VFNKKFPIEKVRRFFSLLPLFRTDFKYFSSLTPFFLHNLHQTAISELCKKEQVSLFTSGRPTTTGSPGRANRQHTNFSE